MRRRVRPNVDAQGPQAHPDALHGDGDTATAEGWRTQRWLRYWLITRTKIRPTTLRSCGVHAERQLIPHLARIRLSELTGRRIPYMIMAIGASTNHDPMVGPAASIVRRLRGRKADSVVCAARPARAGP